VPKYRLCTEDGDDIGEASYVDFIQPARRSGSPAGALRVIDLLPFE
jgi:hypothetical protein